MGKLLSLPTNVRKATQRRKQRRDGKKERDIAVAEHLQDLEEDRLELEAIMDAEDALGAPLQLEEDMFMDSTATIEDADDLDLDFPSYFEYVDTFGFDPLVDIAKPVNEPTYARS